MPRTQMKFGSIKLKEVSDGEGGTLSKEVLGWGGKTQAKQVCDIQKGRGHLLDPHVTTKSNRKKSP